MSAAQIEKPLRLSEGLESLFTKAYDDAPEATPYIPFFNTIIVGSGYGASIAAMHLSAYAGTVAVLERGQQYCPGEFPSVLEELPTCIKYSDGITGKNFGNATGLFDIRGGDPLVALVANGLGGGSLINAGVMEVPTDCVFAGARWPEKFRKSGDLAREIPFEEARTLLQSDTMEPGTDRRSSTSRQTILKSIAKGPSKTGDNTSYRDASVTIYRSSDSKDLVTDEGLTLKSCIGCGDCMTGCNHSSKISLDVSLLAKAKSAGVRLFTGVTVLWLERTKCGNQWDLVIQHTDEDLRRRQQEILKVRADRVVLAAGTYGSTEIMLRSRAHGLNLSGRLGSSLSGNGDQIAMISGLKPGPNSSAVAETQPQCRNIGSTITGVVDLRDTDGVVIEDLAVPAALRVLFEQSATFAKFLQDLTRVDKQDSSNTKEDQRAVRSSFVNSTLAVAIIGHDDADGTMALAAKSEDPASSNFLADELLAVRWPGMQNDSRLSKNQELLQDRVTDLKRGIEVLANPVWKMADAALEQTLGLERGKLITVHPLGGCTMGDDRRSGVVNHLGQVFDPSGSHSQVVYDGLAVLDGSTIPSSLGTNPALTIAALALRNIRHLTEIWELAREEKNKRQLEREEIALEPYRPGETRFEVVERFGGNVTLGETGIFSAEISLFSTPVDIKDVISPIADKRKIEYDPARSRLRIFKPKSHGPVAEYQVSGELQLLQVEHSNHWLRIVRALVPWLLNRGLRDLLQYFLEWLFGANHAGFGCDGLKGMLSRAGGVSRFVYNLKIGDRIATSSPKNDEKQTEDALFDTWKGATIEAIKRITYARASSPLEQLMTLDVVKFPAKLTGQPVSFKVDQTFFASEGVPLFRVVEQHDQTKTMVQIGELLAYFLRVMIDHHLLTFRKPDAAAVRLPNRLAGPIKGAPTPQYFWLSLDDGTQTHTGVNVPDVKIRLTRYNAARESADKQKKQPPVLMLHGYSASSTTFAHPSLDQGLMKFLCTEGNRDVWLLDARTSCGLPTGTERWAFEDVGLEDIPLAVDYIRKMTGYSKIDVVAHCMGSAMLWMGILHRQNKVQRRYERLQAKLHKRINKLVISQVPPVLKVTPSNIARAWLMRYVQSYMPEWKYMFRRTHYQSGGNDIVDRLLSATSLTKAEYIRENPRLGLFRRIYVRWPGTRHRIEATFGKVFELSNMREETLECLDDFFGPFNIHTASQVVHFNRYGQITDHTGFNHYFHLQTIQDRVCFPILTVHGEKNGLVDIGSRDLFETRFKPLLTASVQPKVESKSYCHLGHQDLLIGTEAATTTVFKDILRFLEK
jgi:cholesterol oxidase